MKADIVETTEVPASIVTIAAAMMKLEIEILSGLSTAHEDQDVVDASMEDVLVAFLIRKLGQLTPNLTDESNCCPTESQTKGDRKRLSDGYSIVGG